jgi:FKBP-type peptidyl-prolyl cis-trans isomerase
MATSIQKRIFIIVVIVAFLAVSVGISVAVVISQIINGNSTSSTDSTTTSTTSSSASSSGKLEGTKMKDFTPVATVNKLEITDLTPGTGATVQSGDTVTVDYTGAVAATGVIFQSSLDSGQPVTFALNQVIEGWTLGLPGMKVGGTRRLLIPANEAYGANPPSGSGIPANAALVFDITLHSIGK